MDQIQGMRVFMRVVDLNSFALAARQLGMSAAAVTRSINMLEAHLNLRLINRSTRSLSLTEAGAEYLQGCRRVIDTFDEVESSLIKTTRSPHGTLRIGTSATFAASQLCGLLAAYHQTQPLVDFDISTFDSHIDMIEGGFDVGFTDTRRQPNSSMVSRELVKFEEILVASHTYLVRRGAPAEPAALGSHSLLIVSDGVPRTWELTDGTEIYRVQALRNALRTPSHAVAHAAAVNHLGVALLPMPLIRNDLERGTLVRVLEQYPLNDGLRTVSIVYSGRTQLTAKVRTFIDFSVDFFRARNRSVPLRAAA
ncbi:LysR family transcriptional regulator [Paraburkholderia sp. RL18-103-BIB-C]|jgi:DNA-binding transcriptional LysR family regulator|uniref:LysR family transcriptional regulator n=1 Tax=unclassified Paraburkholderia TaxID=2615204 RepID=UPI0038BB343B